MDNVSFLIEKLYMEGWLRDEEFLEVLIHHGENEIRNLLAEYARKTAHRYYGNKVDFVPLSCSPGRMDIIRMSF